MTTQAELQESLLRFSGDLIARLTDAARVLVVNQRSEPREAALRQMLRYEASALEIATGPLPEVGFCDMTVFVRLCRGVFERHWMGLFGEDARPVLAVWNEAEERMRELAVRAMTNTQWARLRVLIDEWLTENPECVAVEGLRFAEFSKLVGRVAAERADEANGIFGSVKGATAAADQALLLVDRVLFLVSRVPFVLRLHARLAAYELAADAKGQLKDNAPTLRRARSQLDQAARRGLLYLVALGAAWSLLAAGGYVAAKRLGHPRRR